MSLLTILLILAAIAGGIALLTWRANRSIDQWKAQRQAAQAAAKAHLESGSAFGQGAAAALNDEEFWVNPHCKPTGIKDRGLEWNAGWCFGRQQLRDIWRIED
jgi:hypothetical protein